MTTDKMELVLALIADVKKAAAEHRRQEARMLRRLDNLETLLVIDGVFGDSVADAHFATYMEEMYGPWKRRRRKA